MVNGDSLKTPLPPNHIELPIDSHVLRAAIYPTWIDKETKAFKYQAFTLAPKDGDFLSVYERERCHPSKVQTVGGFSSPIHGVAECSSRAVTGVRASHSELLLRVCRTQEEEAASDAHASIYGLKREPTHPTPIDEHMLASARRLLKVFRPLPETDWRPS
jgi:hypothetical protein